MSTLLASLYDWGSGCCHFGVLWDTFPISLRTKHWFSSDLSSRWYWRMGTLMLSCVSLWDSGFIKAPGLFGSQPSNSTTHSSGSSRTDCLLGWGFMPTSIEPSLPLWSALAFLSFLFVPLGYMGLTDWSLLTNCAGLLLLSYCINYARWNGSLEGFLHRWVSLSWYAFTLSFVLSFHRLAGNN